jgi:hypothetical protein
MTLEHRAERGKGRKAMHPLTALFLALPMEPKTGMRQVADRGGLISDNWERYPDVDEVSWGEVIAIFEAIKHRLNPAWCDIWISSIKSKVQKS